jgi:glycosyltransferase involved in cell wall biosynthesis
VIIALDATPLTVSTGGITRYTAELSQALAEQDPEDHVLLLSDQQFTLPPNAPSNLAAGDPPASPLQRRWWLWGLRAELARRHAQVFHGTDFAVPYLPACASVLTIHDLSPWRDPEWQPSARRIRRRTPVLLATGAATLVVTPSQTIRREVLDSFPVEADRVVVTPLAPSRKLHAPEQAAPHPPATFPPFFLFVGTLEPRKNIRRLIDAWREVRRETGWELVLAGRTRPDFTPPSPEPGLRLAGAVPDSELARLYATAAAFVYPSLYEGFGLPVLEAMSRGLPVITSTDPAISEVAAGAAVQVPAADVRGLKEAMLALIRSPETRADLRQSALRRAASFSWMQTASRTRDVYAEAIRRFSRR